VLAFQLFFNFLSVPKRSKHGVWKGKGFGCFGARAFFVVFLFYTWSLVWALGRLDFPGLFVSFSFSLLEYLSIHTSDGCMLGQGKDRTVELKFELD
jgi:hypothetical protein